MKTQIITLLFGLFISFSTIQAQNFGKVWTQDYEGNFVGYANLDNDSNIELLFLTSKSDPWTEKFYIVDGVSGETQYSTQVGDIKWISMITPIDVNNDGISELLMDYFQNTAKKTIFAYGSLGVNDEGIEKLGFYSTSFPNPFSSQTTIEYSVTSETSQVVINIYDQNGNLTISQGEGKKELGNHQFIWNGKDLNGNSVSSGMYFYSIQIDGIMGTKTMIKL